LVTIVTDAGHEGVERRRQLEPPNDDAIARIGDCRRHGGFRRLSTALR
jgi:hypothetical protein